LLLGLVAGEFVNATPFRARDNRALLAKLVASWRAVKVRMADGASGEQLEDDCFLFSACVSRLVHEAAAKVSVRARGVKTALTLQATEGRVRHGGQRFGNMEGEALVATGAAAVLHDRTVSAADDHNMCVCSWCGQTGSVRNDTIGSITQRVREHDGSAEVTAVDVAPCRFCGTTDAVVKLPSVWRSGGLANMEQDQDAVPLRRAAAGRRGGGRRAVRPVERRRRRGGG
jgi:DNA-directed RNA polymerase beta subunit